MTKKQDGEIKIARLEVMMEDVRTSVRELKDQLSEHSGRFEEKINQLMRYMSEKEESYSEKFATKEDVALLKKIVFGGVSLVLMWFVVQVTNLIK